MVLQMTKKSTLSLAGLLAAALLVGTTYDPVLLRQIGADGPMADAAQARMWYQRAKEWGEPDAQRKLDAMARSR